MPTAEKQNVTRYALIPAILTPLCFLFTFGFSLGTTNSAAGPIREFYNRSHMIRFNASLDKATLELLWILTASLFAVGGMFGCLLVRPLLAKLGSRKCIIYSQVVCLLATLLMSSSYAINSYESLIIGRVVLGIFAGFGTGIGPIYVSEISASHIRGILGMCFSLAIAIGVVTGNALGLKQVLGTSTLWPYLLALTALPSLACILYSPWFPESPKALYLTKRDRRGSVAVLKKLRGSDNVMNEIEHLRHEGEVSKHSKPMSILQVVKSRRVRWQMISALMIMSMMQLTGINGIQFYLNDVLILAGISPDEASFATLGITGFQVVATFSGGFLCERFGRKRLLIVGDSIVCFSIVLYTIMVAFQTSVTWFSYVTIVAMLVFIFGFSVGSGAVSFSFTPELLDQSARPAVVTLAVFMLWFWFAVVGFVTPYLFDFLQFAALLPFLLATVLALIFIYKVVPETKGKSVVAIQAIFAKLNKTPIVDVIKPQDNQAYDDTDEGLTMEVVSSA